MQASTPLTPQDARKIALRQGLLFGTLAGCLALLSTLWIRFIPGLTYSFNLIYALAFIAFFLAGQRTAKKTNRIDMGALAGFWAGVVVAVLGLVTLLVLVFGEYQDRGRIPLSSIVFSAVSGITPALLALLFGPAIGALGGFIGKIYAETAVSRPSASPQSPLPTTQPVQSSPSATQPAAPVQPTQSSPLQQNQA